MADKKEFRHRCELFVLQCMPDPLKGEKVNVAVVLRDPSPQNPSILVRISDHMRRIVCLEPGFQLESFEEILQRAESILLNSLDFENRIDHFEEWPEELMLGRKTAVLTDSMPDEIELLAKQYLQPRSWKNTESEAETRAVLVGKMRREFESAGVWGLMDKRLRVADFTSRGDTLKLDCGYADVGNSAYRIFHAVPLVKDGNMTKALAYSWPMIRGGIEAKHKLSCDMRVIVSDGLDRTDETVAFGCDTLENAGLILEPLSRVPHLAEQARVALNA